MKERENAARGEEGTRKERERDEKNDKKGERAREEKGVRRIVEQLVALVQLVEAIVAILRDMLFFYAQADTRSVAIEATGTAVACSVSKLWDVRACRRSYLARPQ